jgi:hypothetical protein
MASSGTGRLWMEKVSGMTDQLRAKALPYVAMTEIALGRTQAGIDHMESARARVEEQAARVAAAQARIDANSARLEALSAGRKFRRMNVFADYSDMSGSVIEVPGVRISEHKIVVQGPTGMVACPRARIKTPLVAVPAPQVSIMQDPI